ncbi:efflux transporter outer membrane subunit [Oricola sp.]|uniref:efflux transporter outer membrane subunit n=1 Tax=Oricola sp. TaxID=1979950 RepID=UPI0025E77AE1|nr:efflux transporter outer membrane subunit [Oricola sp.]MCI5075037.1 efflux transporter outer membrane subunit [Oricola sp.]
MTHSIRTTVAGRTILLLSTAALLSGCVVGPDFLGPQMAMPEKYAEASAYAPQVKADVDWWRDLKDTTLNGLVARGLDQNLDIETANERITAARESAGATGLASQLSGNASAATTVSGSDSSSTTTHSAGLDAAFVFDLFGGKRRNRERALAQLDAARYDAATTRLAFLADLMGSYVNARYYQEALELTRQSIASRRETLRLARERRDIGAGSELDVAQTEADVATAEAGLPSLESSFHANVYHIATLLDEPADPLIRALQRGAPQPYSPSKANAGIPADLLRNRPDVMSAERSLAAATAAIGVAEAELYPSLTLSGSVNVTPDLNSWSFGPALKLPVLNRETLKAERNVAVSEARQAELAWRSAVRQAVEEVQTAQTAYLRARRTVTAARASVEAYAKARDLAQAAYQGGTSTILDLLEAQRSVASARLTLASAIQNMTAQWITMQIAAGRGWSPATAQ